MRVQATLALIAAPAIAVVASDGPSTPRITVSRQTTYLLGPLRPDGTVDYVAALNERYGAGVNRENNAAVLLVLASDPLGREPAASALGLQPKPQGQNFLGILDGTYLDQLGEQRDSPARSVLRTELFRALKTRWREGEHPTLAGWLRANQGPLALAVEASRRPRYFIPIFEANGLPTLAVPSLGTIREMANALVARATSRLDEGDVGVAWDDLHAVHRLALLVSQGPTMIEGLIGITMRGIGNDGVSALLSSAPPALQARRILAAVRALPPLPNPREAFEFEQRIRPLAFWVAVAREVARIGPRALDVRVKQVLPEAELPDLSVIPADAIDWDEVLRTVNRRFEAGSAVADMPRDQAKGVRTALEREIEDERAALAPERLPRLVREARDDPEARRRLGRAIASSTGTLPLSARVAHAESEVVFAMNEAALALVVERAEKGRFPLALTALVPRLLPPRFSTERATPGYLIHYQHLPQGDRFTLIAVPENSGQTGIRTFCLDDSGHVVARSDGAAPPPQDGRCLDAP